MPLEALNFEQKVSTVAIDTEQKVSLETIASSQEESPKAMTSNPDVLLVAEKMKNSSITTENLITFSTYSVSNVPLHMTAHQLYTALKPYGVIKKLSYVIENEKFDLICKQTQANLKSTSQIQVNGDQIHLQWLRDDTEQGDLFDNNQFDCIYSDNDFLWPPSFKTPSAAPIPDSLLTPCDQQSPNHILNALNDDCLIAIFGQNLLDLRDTNEIAVVCKRFHWIVTNGMISSRRRFADHFLNMGRSRPLWQIESFLRAYGASVTYVDLMNFNSAAVVLGMIAEYCPNIQYLASCISKQAALDEMRPFFGKLRRLFLILRTTFDMNGVMVSNGKANLEMWKLMTRHDKLFLPPINLPKLKRFEWKINRVMHKSSLKEFIACNPQLETVILNDDDGELLADLRYFLGALPELQSLKFTYSGYYSNSDEYLSIMRDGNGVQFDAEGRHFTFELMQSTLSILHDMQMPLTRLSTFFYFDEGRADYKDYARAICKFKTITWLHVQGFSDDDMLLFAQYLDNLQYIHNASDGLTFKGIRSVLETASTLTTATFAGFILTEDDEDDVIAIDNIVENRDIKMRVYGVQCNLKEHDDIIAYYSKEDALKLKYTKWMV